MTHPQSVVLLQCKVAGTSYRDQDALQKLNLIPGTVLRLTRDPNNEFDKYAIEVWAAGTMIGFIPWLLNVAVAALMDADLDVGARLLTVDWIPKGMAPRVQLSAVVEVRYFLC